jgi:hypothetical protein
LKLGVAYGEMFEVEQDIMHQAKEFKPVDALLKSTAIYTEVSYELANSNKKIIIIVRTVFAHYYLYYNILIKEFYKCLKKNCLI